MENRLTIQIVGWNSAATLPQTLAALEAVPAEVVIRYIDNASKDNSLELVREKLPRAEVIALPENVGFTNGHNIGFALCRTEFVLTHDPDLQLEWGGVERLIAVLEERLKVAGAQGKLLRTGEDTIIDSTGIVMTLSRNGRERGGGQKDEGQFNDPGEIDAITGACGLFRMSALREVAHGEYMVAGQQALEVFDKDFFAYKDDVDVGWRLKRAGWSMWYEPALAGYHLRTVGVRGVLGWGLNPQAIWQRLTAERTRYSLRNYMWMLMKNMTIQDELRYDWFILPRVLVFLGFSCIYWPLFGVWGEIGRGVPEMMRKRGLRL